MLDLIQVSVTHATTYIGEVRKEYQSWAKKHNATLDASSSVNPDDDFEPGSDIADESNSGEELRAYAAEAPPENVPTSFLLR